MERGQLLIDMGQQCKQLAGSCAAAKHFWELHEDDGQANAGDKSAHYRGGDVFHDSSGLEQKENQKPQGGQDRNQRHQLHGGIGFCRDAKARQQTAHHDGGHCIHAYHELRRGGKQTKGQNGQQGAIQTIDCGQPRNLCVAHGNGDRYQRNDNSGQNIASGIFTSKLRHRLLPTCLFLNYWIYGGLPRTNYNSISILLYKVILRTSIGTLINERIGRREEYPGWKINRNCDMP